MTVCLFVCLFVLGFIVSSTVFQSNCDILAWDKL